MFGFKISVIHLQLKKAELEAMAKHNIRLLICIVLSLIVYIITMVFSVLAGPGISPFSSSTGNVSDEFVTQITPSGWTFSIWGIIYVALALVLLYILSGLFRKNAYGYVYCSPAVLQYGFFSAWCLNLAINTGWLFLWDRRVMPAALAFLILIALTNYAVIFFSCWGLHKYGAWLNKYHKVDLWLHRVLIQNGVAIYATWTTIASLINLNIVLVYDAGVSSTDASTIALSILTVVLVVWFILENSVLDKHVRLILSIYPVVIWALTGVYTKTYNPAAPTRNNIFIVSLLGISCLLFVVRLLLVVWRQIKKPLYRDAERIEEIRNTCLPPRVTATLQYITASSIPCPLTSPRHATLLIQGGSTPANPMMGKHNFFRLGAVAVSFAFFVISLVFNVLSVFGAGPYLTTTANVSAVFDTLLTPPGWTFSIWGVIYIWLAAMNVYIVAGLFRKNESGYTYCSPPVLPYGFFACWCLNQCFNIAWLLVWDRGMMIPALVFLILLVATNYSMIFFCCRGLHIYGAWLKKYCKRDLWLIRALVQNGVMVYTTWTTIATLLNLTIVLVYDANMSPVDAATVSYSLLSVLLVVWFALENTILDKHVRYILITYVVVIWALAGNINKNYDAKSPGRIGIFIAVLLAVSCVLFVIRIILVVWRHFKKPLYEDAGPEAMEVMDISKKDKKIFR
ncbi:hypothetical protein OJAV_G00197550 [Oryzias javanicus]|uniref:Uncharacterized protein n=1 Tax=Oryzias javanicus TaxID=123683 RepID=A0A437C7W8_ORYJA|nr:hypothetical protein OJAV_G00197550 [Oryzias javanicus]